MTKATKSVAAPPKPAAGESPAKGKGTARRTGSRAKQAPVPAEPKNPSQPAPRAATNPSTPSKRSAKPAPREQEVPVDKFLQEQRTLLLAERATYEEQAESLRQEAEQLAADMEPGDIQFDEESGEGGTLNVERERDLALSAQARAAVEEIDRALAKIEQGTYGVCERCGEPIKKARLKALPYASLCISCKSGGLSRR